MDYVTYCTLLHGAGSTPEFVTRTFAASVRGAGAVLVAPDIAGMTMPEILTLLEELSPGPDDVIGGVSLGAHAAAAFAAHTGWHGRLYAAMPAWTGPPGDVAGLTTVTATEIEQHGTARILAELVSTDGDDWVVDELRRAWSAMPQARLVNALRVAGAQPAPTCEELQSVRARVVLVAMADDPTHPLSAAEEWHGCLPDSTLTVLPRDLAGRTSIALADPLAKLLSESR